MITINALPVKKSMQNAFLDYHIFTEYNLTRYKLATTTFAYYGADLIRLKENKSIVLLISNDFSLETIIMKRKPEAILASFSSSAPLGSRSERRFWKNTFID